MKERIKHDDNGLSQPMYINEWMVDHRWMREVMSYCFPIFYFQNQCRNVPGTMATRIAARLRRADERAIRYGVALQTKDQQCAIVDDVAQK